MLHPSEDPRSVGQLLLDARAAVDQADSCDFPAPYWTSIWALQIRRDASLLAQLRELAPSDAPPDRRLAADAVAQGHTGKEALSAQCADLLIEMLHREEHPLVLAAIAVALGHHRAPAAVAPLARWRHHPDAAVRYAIVQGLLCQESALALESLLELSRDTDREVRNWATFGLGSMVEADSETIRDALLARAAEADDEISGEALVGLARRGDLRVVPLLIEAIQSIVQDANLEFGCLLIEAAQAAREASAKAPDDRWEPLLRKLDELGLGKPH